LSPRRINLIPLNLKSTPIHNSNHAQQASPCLTCLFGSLPSRSPLITPKNPSCVIQKASLYTFVLCNLSNNFASCSYFIFISSRSFWNSSRLREKAFRERQKADSSALRAVDSASRREISDWRFWSSCSAALSSSRAAVSALRI